MSFKISIGLVASLLVVLGVFFAVGVNPALAAGPVLVTGSKLPSGKSWCPGCNALETNYPNLYNSVPKTYINNVASEYAANGVESVPSLKLPDGTSIPYGDSKFLPELQKAVESADQSLVGKDVIVGTEQIYVDPLTHEGQTFIPKPSSPQKPPTISLEKQQELAMDEANGVPITAVGNEITFTRPATVNLGVEVGPGTYQVGKCQKNQSPGTGYVQPDASGNFTSCAEPKAPGSDSGFGGPSSGCGPGGCGGGAGGAGGGLGGGLGGAGGLAALLPLLMQGLLGGGQGNQGNLGNTSGVGQGNSAIPCAAYGTSPVCGLDGKTYTNSCYLQQYGTQQVSVGVCGAATSPTPTPNISKIVAQLVASGVPQALIDQITKLLTSAVGTSSHTVTVP